MTGTTWPRRSVSASWMRIVNVYAARCCGYCFLRRRSWVLASYRSSFLVFTMAIELKRGVGRRRWSQDELHQDGN